MLNNNVYQIGPNCQIDIEKGKKYVVYPHFYNKEGDIKYHKIHSKILKNERCMKVYIPPSFHENYLKVYENVLINHDG